MDTFARCFLLDFAELYVGGLLALSIPPFHEIERGFYKSTASVYLGAGCIAFAGRMALLLRSSSLTWGDGIEMFLWAASLAAGGLYLRALWGDEYRSRARLYICAWASGVAALALGAQAFRLGPALSIETVLYPVSFIVSALLLGAVTTGMLLGHWYLIDRGLSIEPFRSMLRFFVAMLAVQTAVLVINGGLLGLLGAPASVDGLVELFHAHTSLLTVRLLLTPIAAAGLAWMIWKTLQIPQTMAATGLFYIAILAVLVGEFVARFILFRTSLPL